MANFFLRDVPPTDYYRIEGGAGTIKATSGYLHNIVIGTVSVAGDLKLYDDTNLATGQITEISIGVPAAGILVPNSLLFNVAFGTALCYDMNGSATVTISYA
uniref:Uncharacterized protein n=1 Tax=viral metagenome TaxID=1070528 RepID=A0A6H1ZXV1_9ZZZZ